MSGTAHKHQKNQEIQGQVEKGTNGGVWGGTPDMNKKNYFETWNSHRAY